MSNLSLFNTFFPHTRGDNRLTTHSMDPFEVFSHYQTASHIEEDDTKYVVEAQVPGVRKDELKIEYKNNVLSVSTKEVEKKDKKSTRKYSYNFNFYLPDNVDNSKINAELNLGLLHITLPKIEEAHPKEIAIS